MQVKLLSYPDFTVLFSVNLDHSLGWREPICWTGPKVALYESFDASSGLVLMEGAQQVGSLPLVSGKVKRIFSFFVNAWINISLVLDYSIPILVWPCDFFHQHVTPNLGVISF